jgi:hypothetical protein
MSERHLDTVLEQIIEIAPDLHNSLYPVMQSAKFAAPENMGYWWRQANTILNAIAVKHEKREQIQAIYSGTQG